MTTKTHPTNMPDPGGDEPKVRVQSKEIERTWAPSSGYLADKLVERFGEVFEAVAQILSPNAKRLKIVEVGGAPGYTDGEEITLVKSFLPSLLPDDPDALVTWIAVVYHEVGHTLYSPRADSPLYARIKAVRDAYPAMGTVLNMAEDQRQERLLIAQYNPLRAYLTQGVGRLLTRQVVETTDVPGLVKLWPLVAGRTWLPIEVRRAARQAFDAAFGTGAKVASLIGAYQRLGDPSIRDCDEAFEILRLLTVLLATGIDMDQIHVCGGEGHPSKGDDLPAYVDEDEIPVAGDPEDEADLRKSATESTDDDTGSDVEDGDGGDGDADDSSDGGDGDADAEGDEAGDGDADSGDSSDSGDAGEDSSTGDGSGAGDGDADVEPMRDLKDVERALRSSARAVIDSDEETTKDLDHMQKAVYTPGTGTGLERMGPTTSRPVSSDMVLASERMMDHFRLFTDRALPYWERRVDHGKLNVRRYMTRSTYMDYDTLFDRFDPGNQDEMSLDVTIHVDVSSSMNSPITGAQRGHNHTRVVRAWEMAWVIRRAVQDAEGDCTLVAYNTRSWEVAGPDEKASPTHWEGTNGSGGTNPASGLVKTAERLARSDAAHKLVILLTDGDWHSGADKLNQLNSVDGVTTIGVLIYDEFTDDAALYRHATGDAFLDAIPTHYGIVTADPAGVVSVFEDVAAAALARAEAEKAEWS